jgi:hypothetical protein
MGQEPAYIFSYAVATRGNPHWHNLHTIRSDGQTVSDSELLA